MASERGIADAIEMLVGSGCVMPKSTNVSTVGVVWNVTMPDVDDDSLMAACLLWLRSPNAGWWPKPGQLLALLKPASNDYSGEDWGRLRMLRQTHGANEPQPPGEPDWFSLSANRAEAQARWAGIVAVGGWSSFVADGGLAEFVAGYQTVIDGAKQKLLNPKRWSTDVRQLVSDWLARADGAEAYRDLRYTAAVCGSAVPLDPLARRPFRLHDNPQRERAMAAGLAAAGGWREIWPSGSTIPENLRASDAANRRAFVNAYKTTIDRIGQRHEQHKVAALVDMTVDQLAIGTRELK